MGGWVSKQMSYREGGERDREREGREIERGREGREIERGWGER